ncbi:MAG: VanW family protein [Lachnospiraceae bacterium]|nr:VanW family protein [Lachnospiraceae bacterium]
MKNAIKKGMPILAAFGMFLLLNLPVQAQAEDVVYIKDGIYVSDMHVGGMTVEEATSMVEEYVENLLPLELTLQVAQAGERVVTAEELGLNWQNPDVIREAAAVGQEGTIIQRYKMMKDLQQDNLHFDLELGVDVEATSLQVEACAEYDRDAINMSLKREGGEFIVIEGQTGYKLDVEKSIDQVITYITEGWDHQPGIISLVVEEELPKGSAEELAMVQDELSSYTTSFKSSGQSRSANVINGCNLIDGTVLYPGEEFSTYESVAPFTEKNGYYMAGSYVSGKVVDSLGGGICQVSTTLYNAALYAELEITERYNHSMIVSYVDPSADAAIAESSGKDFKFVNNTEYPIYSEGKVKDKKLTFTIYGKETRPENRTVTYESVILETIPAGPEEIYTDAGQPIGYVAKQSAHIGYKAQLWKVVTVDGEEVSREQVNRSSYKMTPRQATFGVATADPNAYNEIMAAIGTGSIDHTVNVMNYLITAPVQPQGSENASQ